MRWAFYALVMAALLTSCVPNRSYHANAPVFHLQYPDDHRFYQSARAGLAFIEFDKRGRMFDPSELTRALGTIAEFQAMDQDLNREHSEGIVVFVFVHGWKNSASDRTANPSGFRKALDEFAVMARPRPVLGIYIGWPGVGWPGKDPDLLENFSFEDRKQVAHDVGGDQLPDALRQIMQKTKGADYQGKSSCILVGHSFGGLALETAITPLLTKLVEGIPAGASVRPPADLIVLLNEAGPALLAKPFLYYLADHGVDYQDANGKSRPLLLSMTSQGDVATKFAFPAGQAISFRKPNLPDFPAPDQFGIDSDKTYYLLTTANTIALQNRQFVRRQPDSPPPENTYVSPCAGPRLIFDVVPQAGNNHTPYWVMQLPQVFVPDHGTVFGFEFIHLLGTFLDAAQIVSKNASGPEHTLCPAATAQPHPLQAMARPAPSALDTRLKKQR